MTLQEILVLISGTVLIIFILWFFFGKKETEEARVSKGKGGEKQEAIIVVEGAYSPNETAVKKGIPVEITFDRRESGDCSEWVIFASGKWRMANGKVEKEIKAKLAPFAETKVEFTPMETGEFPFVCGMGMLHGKLIVKE
ncbi:MAG: cupredoxin domain-containing protein [bacterium]|nr:cupredoxin domain-containing protein [bacterium]